LVNYLALLGWSPGEGEEMLPVAEMAQRFDLGRVGHSAAVFDTNKLAWMNRQYMKAALPARIAREALPYFSRAGYLAGASDDTLACVEMLLPMAVGSVDRLEEIPERVAFVFDWDETRAAALVAAEEGGARAVRAFAAEMDGAAPLTRDTFRAAAARARETCGLKGRALFHPIRVALTAAQSGPELDLAVPAIDRIAARTREQSARPTRSCYQRVLRVVDLLAREDSGPASSIPGTK
jgi:glutamyl/glutaminyl-tRNA synthetase